MTSSADETSVMTILPLEVLMVIAPLVVSTSIRVIALSFDNSIAPAPPWAVRVSILVSMGLAPYIPLPAVRIAVGAVMSAPASAPDSVMEPLEALKVRVPVTFMSVTAALPELIVIVGLAPVMLPPLWVRPEVKLTVELLALRLPPVILALSAVTP